MKRHEALLALLLGWLMVVGGLTWAYGHWGLIGGGGALFLAVFFVDLKGDGNG